MRPPNPSGDTSVQKTKKQKQAPEISRKDATDGNNKENVNQTNTHPDSDASTIMDSTTSSRPVRVRRTKMDNLVSLSNSWFRRVSSYPRVSPQRLSVLCGEVKVKKEPVEKKSVKPKVAPEVAAPATEKRKSNEDAANLSTESNKKVKVFIVLIRTLFPRNPLTDFFPSSWTTRWS